MGNACGATIARPLETVHRSCGRLAGNDDHSGYQDDDDVHNCGLCDQEVQSGTLHGAPGVLSAWDNMQQDDGTPQTPRGPIPPWAVAAGGPPIDRTATGATPPRSPTPARMTPPGMPDDEAREAITVLSLHSTFDAAFLQDLFGAARSGNTNELSTLLHQVHGGALTLVCNSSGSNQGQVAAERCEKAAEMVANFLSKARDNAATPRETLLGAAASGGHLEAVQLLLSSRADPVICDDQGNTALHRAAESGRLLTVLLVLDRMQATARALNVSELQNEEKESPEQLAMWSGASDVCRAFEIFGDMQNDAELRQLGSGLPTDMPSSQRGTTASDVIALMDLAADATNQQGSQGPAAMLRRAVAGGGLVPNLHIRIPDDEGELRILINKACRGIQVAEQHLLKHDWDPSDPQIEPALRPLVTTLELRRSWQLLRLDVLKQEQVEGVEEFWQTHLSAETMVATMTNARGDTFQLLLTVLWLYTREAWLRHVVDALAIALRNVGMPPVSTANSAADGATGATPLLAPVEGKRTDIWNCTSAQSRLVIPLVEALGPCLQLVQGALSWFEEKGIRHQGLTYRPFSIPTLGLRAIERHMSANSVETGNSNSAAERSRRRIELELSTGTWVALGAGAFFSAMSSRSAALRRMTHTRCNVLLVVRPDDRGPLFPKQMSLRGSAVDDVLFPMGALFRVVRITKTVSSDLDPDGCGQGTNSRWPVHIIELAAANRFLESMEVLEKNNDLGCSELEMLLQHWVEGGAVSDHPGRLLQAGELLGRCSAYGSTRIASGDGSGTTPSATGARIDCALDLLCQAAAQAEKASDAVTAGRALLAKTRCQKSLGTGRLFEPSHAATDAKHAMKLLEESLGANHPETCAARTAWRELGVLQKR